jgi:mevalonate pyrophosphate decarboxylase
MMMMSEPAFILMKTGTLEVINKLWNFRKETGPLFFTLDAGANVHLLFPENESSEAIKNFIETELSHAKGGVVKDVMSFKSVGTDFSPFNLEINSNISYLTSIHSLLRNCNFE